MADPRAQRTLVKSPPELWAEVSDLPALARHLGEFGEIRITRLEPETTVAWEGDTARGTVELQASGWGTKVTLTAELVDQPDPEPERAPEPVVEEPAPEPVATVQPEPEPTPVAATPEPASPKPAKVGFWARLFGRRPAVAAVEEPAPVAEPTPAAETVAEPVTEAVAAPEPPVAEAPELVPDEPDAEPGELRVGEPVRRSVDHDQAVAVLTGVLDDLGAAHHRPFSRS